MTAPEPSTRSPLQRQDLNTLADEALVEALRLVPADQPDEAVEAVTAMVLGSLRPQVERAVRQVMGAMA
jgi:hypothetical protein